MRVSISMKVSVKDRPKEHRGLVSEDWTIGREAECKLADAIIAFVMSVDGAYGACYPADELNDELAKAQAMLANLRFGPVQDAPDSA